MASDGYTPLTTTSVRETVATASDGYTPPTTTSVGERVSLIEDKTGKWKRIDSSGDTDAGVQVSVGAYMAVVMAAFGGVRKKTAFNKTSTMHPFIVAILVVPLFVVQMTTIFAIRLDLDVNKGVVDFSILESDRKISSLISMKCLMVLVVQLTTFGVLLSNLRMFIFVLNPITWFEVAHPEHEEWLDETVNSPALRMIKIDSSLEWKMTYFKWLSHPFFLAIPCIVSLSCRFAVSYLVCVDSMSIIFAASTMTEAVFNALVLTFINDLNEIYWQFLSVILNLDGMDEFKFTLRSDAANTIGKITKNWSFCGAPDPREDFAEAFKSHPDIRCPAFLGRVIKCAPVLSRGSGFRRLENCIAFLCLFGIYLKQLFVAIFALATNVLPVARDICTMWRWSHGEAAFLKKLGPLVIQFIQMVTLVHLDLDNETAHMPIGSCRPAKEDDKTGMFGIYYRMVTSDMMHMMTGAHEKFVKTMLDESGKGYKIVPSKVDNHWTSLAFWVGFVCILAIAILPQWSAFTDLLRKASEKICPTLVDQELPALQSEPTTSEEIAQLKAKNAVMDAIIAAMKKDIEDLKDKRN